MNTCLTLIALICLIGFVVGYTLGKVSEINKQIEDTGYELDSIKRYNDRLSEELLSITAKLELINKKKDNR